MFKTDILIHKKIRSVSVEEGATITELKRLKEENAHSTALTNDEKVTVMNHTNEAFKFELNRVC